MKKNEKFFAPINILLATLLFILYVVFVAYPFLAANQPPNEATSKWAYDYAPVHYALIYFPAFALYVYAVLKNILNIKFIRFLIYPLVFVILFIATHMVFFVYSMLILWFCLITIPVGFVALVSIIILAIILDIKDFKNKTEINNGEKETIQKVLNKIGLFVVPLLLTVFVINLHFYITVFKP